MTEQYWRGQRRNRPQRQVSMKRSFQEPTLASLFTICYCSIHIMQSLYREANELNSCHLLASYLRPSLVLKIRSLHARGRRSCRVTNVDSNEYEGRYSHRVILATRRQSFPASAELCIHNLNGCSRRKRHIANNAGQSKSAFSLRLRHRGSTGEQVNGI